MGKASREYKKWMKKNWGPRCKTFCWGCPCCEAWAAYRFTRGKFSQIEEAVRKATQFDQKEHDIKFANKEKALEIYHQISDTIDAARKYLMARSSNGKTGD